MTIWWHSLSLLAIALCVAAINPIAARADTFTFTPVDWCASQDDFTRDDWAIYTREPLDQDSAKRFLADRHAAQACKASAHRSFQQAYLFAWVAALEHDNARPWQTDMNRAIQLLEQCVTRNYGAARGAQCQTDLETNIHRKVTWSAEDSR